MKKEFCTYEQALVEFRKTPMTFVPDERMYSEEDMIEFAVWLYLEVGSNSGKDRTNEELFKEWFEQNKKK